MVSEARQIRMSIGVSASGRLSADAEGLRKWPYSWARPSAAGRASAFGGRTTAASRPSALLAQPEEPQGTGANEGGQAEFLEALYIPWLWAWLDSGMISTSLFVIAMIIYMLAVAPGNDPYDAWGDSSYDSACWLWLVGALLFTTESLMDMAFAVKRWIAGDNLIRDKEAAADQTNEADGRVSRPRTSAATAGTGGGWMVTRARLSYGSNPDQLNLPFPWLDEVHWDFWAAFWFFIPSLLTLQECFLDEYSPIKVWPWLNIFKSSMDDATYSVQLDNASAILYVFDALIGLVGRYSYVRTTAPADRLFIFTVWKVENVWQVDWAAWGDILFLVGAATGVVCSYDVGIIWLQYVSYSLWLFNGVVYLIACYPTLRSMMKETKVQ